MKRKDIIFKAFADRLKKDDRVSGLFLTGSANNGTSTIFSDLDLWVIFTDESGLNSFRNGIASWANAVAKVRGIYECTAHHYFIVYKPSIQIDLNLVTSAHFFSIKNSKKKFIFDHKLFLENRKKARKRTLRFAANDFLFQSYTTLERCASKLLKGDCSAAVCFLNRIREDFLIPLFKIAGIQKIATPKSLNVQKLSSGLRELFIETYANPTERSCAQGIRAVSAILSEIASRLKIKGLEDYKVKFKNFSIIN